MSLPARFSVFLLLFLGATAPSFSQGGFGGVLGAPGQREDGDVRTSTNILTPGQFTEYPLTVGAGEAILAEVETSNFDSALQVMDASGKVLAENDDARPGEQDARLLFRFPTTGAYKLVVRAFKGAAGGQFELRLRRFFGIDIALGKQLYLAENAREPRYFRVSATAEQRFLVTTLFATTPALDLRVFSPTGETLLPTRTAQENIAQFTAAQAGDYFVRIVHGPSYRLTIAAMRTLPHTLGEKSAEQILPGEGGDLWRFSGKAGQVVRIRTQTSGAALSPKLSFVPGANELPDGAVSPLSGDAKDRGTIEAVLNRTGAYEVSVLSGYGGDVRYSLSTTFPATDWRDAERRSMLARGTTDSYLIDGKAGEILRLDALSPSFDASLELLDLEAGRLAINDDGGENRDARLTQLLTKTGKYLVRVSCYGGGGSGAYQLKRSRVSVRSIMLGKRETGTVRVGEPEVWSFTGKAGQIVILSARSDLFAATLQVFGDDGAAIWQPSNLNNNNDSLLSLKLPKDGAYTVWVSTRGNGGTYRFRLLDGD